MQVVRYRRCEKCPAVVSLVVKSPGKEATDAAIAATDDALLRVTEAMGWGFDTRVVASGAMGACLRIRSDGNYEALGMSPLTWSYRAGWRKPDFRLT